MQDAIFYVAAGETLGVVRDYANAKNVSVPTLVRGVSARLRMRIFARKEGPEPYPMDALADIVRWQWAMDSDFNEATSYKLQADNANITLSEVQDDIDGDEFTYTEVSTPIPDTNSEELAAWIGTDKSKGGLHGELVGYDANGAEIFVLQVENFTLRNRITSLGAPTPVSADYLTASQVAAMIAAGLECQFSADGESWHAVQQPGDAFLRMRVRNSGGVWSDAFRLLAGPKGEPGRKAFLLAVARGRAWQRLVDEGRVRDIHALAKAVGRVAGTLCRDGEHLNSSVTRSSLNLRRPAFVRLNVGRFGQLAQRIFDFLVRIPESCVNDCLVLFHRVTPATTCDHLPVYVFFLSACEFSVFYGGIATFCNFVRRDEIDLTVTRLSLLKDLPSIDNTLHA